jgi:hypothetical protein
MTMLDQFTKDLLNTPPVTLALLIVLMLLVIFRAYAVAAANAHRTTATLAETQTVEIRELYGKVERLTHANGVLSAEIYRLKDALNDCLNRGEL